jgi:hypothetical protein
MDRNIFWRIIVAVIVVLALNAILVPLSNVLGFPISGDVLTILRVCVAAIALLYVVKGPPVVP